MHNDAVPELKLRLSCLVFDDDEKIVESPDGNDLKHGDGMVILLEIISLRTSVGVIVDLSSSFNRTFLLRGYHPLSAIAFLFFETRAKLSFQALLIKGMISVDE